MANEITQTNGKTEISFTNFITSNKMTQKINEIIGDENKGARFVSSIVSAVNANPALRDCENASILSGALLGESLNLSPSPQLGNYYLVPFNDKTRGQVATFQLGLTI